MDKRLLFVAVVVLFGVFPLSSAEKGSSRQGRATNKATCTASCGTGTPVSCSVQSGTCSSVNRNCSTGQRGHVLCGQYGIQCAQACPVVINCSGNGVCNSICGNTDPDCRPNGPCNDRPEQGCYYYWSPETDCCRTTNAGCVDICF